MNRLFRYGCWGIACAILPTGCVTVAPQSGAPLFWEQQATRHPPETAFDGAVIPRRPRLVYKPADAAGPGRTFAEVRALRANDPVFRKIFDKALAVPDDAWHPAMAAACWIATDDDVHAERAIRLMLSRRIRRSGRGYSNIWTFALAYDWLYEHPAMTPGARAAIEHKLADRLESELAKLDGQYMALWHGRNQAANNAMIAALAIGDRPRYRDLLRRATAHYADSLRALAHTEAWPEGASYWIYNRAGPYALAADCFMTAFGTDALDGLAIREIMKRIGYWQIYQFGPNETFEAYGDSQGSLRLGATGWWELTTDYFARLSGDPGVMAGADYIRNRSPIPYGKRPYYWYVALTYDPVARPANDDYDPVRPELWMRENFPQAMLFGRNSMGLVFFRGRWGDPDETYAVFHAGDYFTHHEHYDVGHFGIQKGGWLAPRTGLMAPGYTSDHRLGYMTQTVSANSLLVLAPGETSSYLAWRGGGRGWAWLSGGQRAIRPTGFLCANFGHFRELLHSGPHLKRADIAAFESVPGLYDYVAANITAAYNSTVYAEPEREPKVALATRSFLYLRPLDAFVVYDRIETTRADYLPKFLLHHLDKPHTESERLLAGNSPDDGILETPDRLLVSQRGRGRLEHRVLLPEPARVLKIGGPNHYAYVEHTGTQADGFTGRNLATGLERRNLGPTFAGEWRTEVEPAESGTSVRFLNVLAVRLRESDPMPSPSVRLAPVGNAAHAAAVGDWLAVFAREPAPLSELEFDLAEPARVLVLDAVPNGVYRAGDRDVAAGNEGVLDLGRLPAGRHAIRAAQTISPPPLP